MSSPPRLVTRALAASFGTVAVVLLAVFTLISIDIRQRIRESVAANLDAGQQVFARVERLRQQELLRTVSTLAENPTLKAALDTWQTERHALGATHEALVATVQRELDKIAAGVEVDVLSVVDVDGQVVASAGPRASGWTRGVRLRADAADGGEAVALLPAGAFRVVGVPLLRGDMQIGSLEVGRALDGPYAEELADLGRGESAILIGDRVVATTLPPATARELASSAALDGQSSAVVKLAGETFAVRHLYDVPPASFLTLASIDRAAARATRDAQVAMAWIAALAMGLAVVGSFWLARTLTRPVDTLAASLRSMALDPRFDAPVPMTGSSRELDALAETFNRLIGALADAEAQTQAAYLGAIRALAAALDARDPYTAGHSERVSALAVAMGRMLELSDHDLDTLRLGALLHDVGKIGVPDDILGKPTSLTPSEFELIRTHPVIGARILRSIPFLAPHLPIVELHHERPDGRGYPYGLEGEAIPLSARIVHVADAYDAMTSARAYRPALPPHEAIAELRRGAGTDFDPEAVQALVTVLPRLPALLPGLGLDAVHLAALKRRVS